MGEPAKQTEGQCVFHVIAHFRSFLRRLKNMPNASKANMGRWFVRPQSTAAADHRARSLMARLISNGPYHNYWRADNKTRPFFHPSDAGLPVISLLEYSEAAATPAIQKHVRDAVKRSLQFELATTADVKNPFGYARQVVRMGNGTVRTAFFFPHDTEAAPWWQGEDARLASLAAAARMAAPLFPDDPAFQKLSKGTHGISFIGS